MLTKDTVRLVILNKVDYDAKILHLWNDKSTYSLAKRNPTSCIERDLNEFVFKLFENKHIPESKYRYLHSTDSRAPCISGLPKINKDGCPLRPIVLFVNSPLYNLSKFIYRTDGPVDRASASEAADAGSIPVSGQAEDFRKLAFTASLLGVQH